MRESRTRLQPTARGWSNFLRKSHLDELPQVLNIIAGSMSIVGPRPMIDEVVDTLEPDDRITRSMVKPGLTGPWQTSTMGGQSMHDHPELDNQYVEKASLASDIRIVLITGATVFGKKPLEPTRLEQRLGTQRWQTSSEPVYAQSATVVVISLAQPCERIAHTSEPLGHDGAMTCVAVVHGVRSLTVMERLGQVAGLYDTEFVLVNPSARLHEERVAAEHDALMWPHFGGVESAAASTGTVSAVIRNPKLLDALEEPTYDCAARPPSPRAHGYSQ